MPIELVYGFAYLKKAAAYTNCDLGTLSSEKRDLIAKACEIEDKDEQEQATIYICRIMKRFFESWNKDNVDDEVIIVGEITEKKSNTRIITIKTTISRGTTIIIDGTAKVIVRE